MNSSVKELYSFTPSFEWPTYRFKLCHCSGTGLGNGTYYFAVVAVNEYGEYTTECLEVVVRIPPEKTAKNGGNDVFQFLPQVLLYITIGGLLLLMIFLYTKIRK
ncbi:MAG: hypothetical protein ACFE9R_06915 [Candidatus Hermodarchaeota archaeon]